MGQVRLSDLSLLNIESETFDSIVPDKIVDDFCNKKSRRVLILICFQYSIFLYKLIYRYVKPFFSN